jgi:transketolase
MVKAKQTSVPEWQEYTRQVAQGIRIRVLEHTINKNGGYLSQACSSSEIFAALYTKILNIGPSQAPMVPLPFPGVPSADNDSYFTGVSYNGPKDPHLDRFFISPVQYALVLYATLVEVERMAPEGLAMFNQDGSTVEMIGAEHSPGHEITAGSLGQALSQVAGISIGRRMKGETGRNFIFMSDGEFQIGQTWEAFEIMSFYKVDNVVVYVKRMAPQKMC